MSTKEVDMPYNFVKHSQSLNLLLLMSKINLNLEQTLKAKLSTHYFNVNVSNSLFRTLVVRLKLFSNPSFSQKC